MASALALSRLLQLASPLLPVGAYCYSQGLEWAIESGEVKDVTSAQAWIGDSLQVYQARFELPVLYKLYQAWQVGDLVQVQEWDSFYQAGRDTAEGWAETRQMGYSLRRLLNDLKPMSEALVAQINTLQSPAFPTLFAAIAQHWQIPPEQALQGYVWGWLENQASAAMKAVPLGQVAGQTILLALGERLPQVVASAMTLPEEHMSNFNPLLSIAGCQHETQYSRLFRS
ncbi:urease accessory protein UreF [Methylophilus sp.]|uniref:urease accessory protein UreF n=1 Tax=Methylophilus sp. TaxID=29541 RepID=UPI000D4FB83C|nr:urease accessory protein UreF [Methylophilus sp.]PPD13147.1 MAG: urease accessory protein UreF [Methylophilus sp.]